MEVCYYRPQRSCGQGNIFTPVCHSVNRGRGSASMHAGIPTKPPRTRQTPPVRHQPPRPHRPPRSDTPPPTPPGSDTNPPGSDPPRSDTTPPRPGRPPGSDSTPPDQADPPGKQTPAYGLRAAGTHPTGMHSWLSDCVGAVCTFH